VRDDTTVDQGSKRDALAAIDEIVALAPDRSLLVTDAAARFLSRRFELERLGPARGYVLRHARERSAGSARGPAAIFVGRERELGLLRAMFDATVTGRGGVVGIAGDAGLGKSRLLAQFAQALDGRPFTYVEGRCLPYGTGIPYLPILDIVRGIIGIDEEDRPDDVTAKLERTLARLGLDDAVALSLRHLLTFSAEAALEPRPAPEAVKAGIFEAIHRLVISLSTRAPLVLVVEDLHWIDSVSAELLASLAAIVSERPILMVTTYRPGYRPPWIDRSYATQLALSGLTPGEGRTLIEVLLDTDDEPVIQVLLAKAEGNPFFLEELALALRDHPGDPRDAVPDTVHDVIVSRIDRLSLALRTILQSAAVVGRDVPFWLLRAVVDEPEDLLRRALGELRAAEFLYETTFGTDPDHVFKHALTHDVAYATVTDMSRRQLHRRVVEAIELRFGPDLADHAERLAHHATRGEVWEKAITYWRQVGLRALSHSSHDEAVAGFEQALIALRHVPARRENVELAIDVRFDLRSAMLPLGQFGKILEHLQEAQRLAESLGDQPRLGRACAYLTEYFRQVGDHARGLEAGQRGLALATAHGDLALEVTTQIYLAHVLYDTGRFRAASDLLRQCVESVRGLPAHERFGLPYIVSVHARTWLALCCAELGQFREALDRAHEAMQIAETADHPSSLTSAHVAVGRVQLRRGDVTRAIPALERGLELARHWNLRFLFPFLAEALGLAHLYSGRVPDGLALLREAQAVHMAMRGGAGQALRLFSLSQGHLIAGDVAEAERLAVAALEMAARYDEMANATYARFQLGEVALARTPRETAAATTHYREALAEAEKLEMWPLVARCRLGLGIAAGRRADVAAALDLLIAADMPLWREQAERALAALG
jgi:tetratricopeptide (TPR) repeat protein